MHVAAAALGISSLLVSSATAFSVVKYLGAAYLVFLGIRRLLARDDDAELRAAGTMAGWLRGRTGFLRAQRYVSGSIFVGLGLATALSGSRKS